MLAMLPSGFKPKPKPTSLWFWISETHRLGCWMPDHSEIVSAYENDSTNETYIAYLAQFYPEFMDIWRRIIREWVAARQ